MDEIDKKILSILQQDADLTNGQLAEQVALSTSSCLRRVQRLTDLGVIRKTVVLTDTEKLGRDLIAIVDVYLERHGDDPIRGIKEAISREAAVLQAYSVAGDADMVLVLALSGMKEYKAICDRLFQHDTNVLRFTTKFVMETVKWETALPVD